jgi:hypothetical protein
MQNEGSNSILSVAVEWLHEAVKVQNNKSPGNYSSEGQEIDIGQAGMKVRRCKFSKPLIFAVIASEFVSENFKTQMLGL